MSQHLSMVSKGVVPFGKGYIFWPSISGVSCYGCCSLGVTLECMWSIPVQPFTPDTSDFCSCSECSQSKPGASQGYAVAESWETLTTVTWLLVRHWFGWLQESFFMSNQSAKDWYSLGLRSSESQDHVPSGGFSDLPSTLVCGCSGLWDKDISLWVCRFRDCFLKCLLGYFLLSALLG